MTTPKDDGPNYDLDDYANLTEEEIDELYDTLSDLHPPHLPTELGDGRRIDDVELPEEEN